MPRLTRSDARPPAKCGASGDACNSFPVSEPVKLSPQRRGVRRDVSINQTPTIRSLRLCASAVDFFTCSQPVMAGRGSRPTSTSGLAASRSAILCRQSIWSRRRWPERPAPDLIRGPDEVKRSHTIPGFHSRATGPCEFSPSLMLLN